MSKTHVLTPYIDQIKELYDQIKQSSEFEFDFNKDKKYVNTEKYILLLEYLSQKHRTEKKELQKNITLDVIYSEKEDEQYLNSYRITLIGQMIIDKYVKMLHTRRSHAILTTLLKLSKKKELSDVIELSKKNKKYQNKYDQDNLNLRIRLTKESSLTEKDIAKLENLDNTAQSDIIFRYKQRVSLILEEDDVHVIKIDLTDVKMAKDINYLDRTLSNYELELELFAKKDFHKTNYLDTMIESSILLLKILQQNNFVTTSEISKNVLEEYGKLLSLGNYIGTELNGRKPISLEIQYATDSLTNKYAVTDKADGDRYFLIICFNHVYIISQTLNVKDTGIDIKNKEYNGTILDGEYIFLPKHNRYLFMAFDCLFSKGKDIRKNGNFLERLHEVDDVISQCFILKDQKGFEYGTYKGKNEVPLLEKFHKNELKNFIEALLKDMMLEKKYPLVRRKYFIPVTGLEENEIFKYSMIIWNQYVYENVKFPYSLDGLVYHPLNQPYITNVRESKYHEFKWKPPEKNSIDFYIQYEKDKITGKPLKVYDNSNEWSKNQPYYICYLYVGKKLREGEQPVPFKNDESKYIINLYLKDGEVRDLKGNIIQDRTVVEFYYNINSELEYKLNWIPIRTRYDKTEMVQRHKSKYGNYSDVADRVWRSIINPVLIEDIKQLAGNKTYKDHLLSMRNKIDHAIIMSTAKEDIYHQVKTNLAKSMRSFHNFVKDLIIVTYCFPTYQQGKHQRVLDVGIGIGGDIMKYYLGNVSELVGIDPESESLNGAVDSASSRYNRMKKKKAAFFKATFICADFTIPLDVDDQMKVIKDASYNNLNLISTFFPKTKTNLFDRIFCQFAFHYFLKDEYAWKNVCDNINKCLRSNGYLSITTFDAQRIVEAIGENDKYTIYYDDKGEKKILFDIVKKYKDVEKNEIIGLGNAIDVHNSMISREDVYNTEYLVDKDFLVPEMLSKCNMKLVDTDTFDHIFEIQRDYLVRVSDYEEHEKTHEFLREISTFYDQDNKINKECFKLTRLYRYYIFKKIDVQIVNKEPTIIKSIKGKSKNKKI